MPDRHPKGQEFYATTVVEGADPNADGEVEVTLDELVSIDEVSSILVTDADGEEGVQGQVVSTVDNDTTVLLRNTTSDVDFTSSADVTITARGV